MRGLFELDAGDVGLIDASASQEASAVSSVREWNLQPARIRYLPLLTCIPSVITGQLANQRRQDGERTVGRTQLATLTTSYT